jgi:hypothetical protein
LSREKRFAGFELIHLLLLVTAAELALNRLATRELRPPGGETPPLWHQVLDHIGLFCQYFASTLAMGIIGYHVWRLVRERELYWSVPRAGLAVMSVPFLVLAFINMTMSPDADLSFWLETCFVAMVLFLVLGQAVREGDLGVKLGMVLLAAPLLIHYYGPFSFRVMAGEEALWSDLPERVQRYGQWTMVMAALMSPYCLAPRPFMRSAARLAPLAVATFVGVIGVVIVRQHYEVGMRLAHRGLGVELGPGAPSQFLALYLIALGTVTWTLTACLTADSVARRDIGVGLALVVVGGYGFDWPLQYLVSMVGLMTIGAATVRVTREEPAQTRREPAFRAPPIADPVWNGYVARVIAALSQSSASADPAEHGDTESADAPTQTVTVRGEGNRAITHIVGRRHRVDVSIRVERRDDSIVAIEIRCGRDPRPDAEPQWTMYARPERLLGIGAHPEPPATRSPVRKIDDPPFEQRFRVRDAGGLTDALLDEAMRARATALIDGWVAYWDGRGLIYCVFPGHGAPLDHPIPITELAFRGSGAEPAVERLVRLIDLLSAMTSRALTRETSEPA